MPGVSALEHRADTCAFVGVITASGDALRLVPPVRASPGAPADAWLRALLAGSRAALHRAVDQARKGKARAPRREWVLAHGAQPLGVALAMHFALAVEAALEGGPGAAPAALAALAAALEAEAVATLGLLHAVDPGPRARAAVAAVAGVDIAQRDALAAVAAATPASARDFAWQARLRVYWEAVPGSADRAVGVRLLLHRHAYALDPLPAPARPVVGTAAALRLRQVAGAALHAGTGCALGGKADTCALLAADLAAAFGAALFVVDCGLAEHRTDLARAVKGMPDEGAGTWVLLARAAAAPPALAAALAGALRALHVALRARLVSCRVDGDTVPLPAALGAAPPCMLLALSAPRAGAAPRALPESLRGLLRGSWLATPDMAVVLEVTTRPPPSRTKWTRRVPDPVLIGHAASLTPY